MIDYNIAIFEITERAPVTRGGFQSKIDYLGLRGRVLVEYRFTTEVSGAETGKDMSVARDLVLVLPPNLFIASRVHRPNAQKLLGKEACRTSQKTSLRLVLRDSLRFQ
jgi:hypothetical protein